VGFLGFGKKKKLPSEIELDAPPEPPKTWMEGNYSSEPIDEELMPPKGSPQPKLEDLPPLPRLEEPVPEFQDNGRMEDDFNLPEIKPKEKKGFFGRKKKPLPEIPPLPSEEQIAQEPVQEFPTIPEQMEPETPVKAEMPEKAEQPKPLSEKYVSMDDFRTVQDNILDARHSARNIEEFFVKFSESKELEDKEHIELHNSFADIHQKILFIDKTLFEESSREV
jgi:hypothetical protein